MIILLTGENNFAIREYINRLAEKYDEHAISRREGLEISPDDLPELLEGTNLFASERLVVVKEAGANKQLWDSLNAYIERIPAEIELVLVESSPDKRTKTYKTLNKVAKVREFLELNEQQAREWVIEKVKSAGQVILPSDTTRLIEMVGTDQWRLFHEIDKLLLLKDTTSERINEVVEATPQANVFTLIDLALNGRPERLAKQLRDIRTEADPYRIFGLLASQVFQLALLASDKNQSAEKVAKEIGAHPYPLKKLRPLANQLSTVEVRRVVDIVTELDTQLKNSSGEPWLLIEQALMKISNLRKP